MPKSSDSKQNNYNPKAFSKSLKMRASRLRALQLLYVCLIQSKKAHWVLDNYDITQAEILQDEDKKFLDCDAEIVSNIVIGVEENKQAIDTALKETANDDMHRTEAMLLTILRAGAYEVLFTEIKPAILVTEYITITSAYFDAQMCKLVHAVLDNLVKNKTSKTT